MGDKDKVGIPLFPETPASMDVTELLQGLRNYVRTKKGGRPPIYNDRKLAAIYELLRRGLGWSAEKSRGWITDNLKASESTVKRAGRTNKVMGEYSLAELFQIVDNDITQESFTADDFDELRTQRDSPGSED